MIKEERLKLIMREINLHNKVLSNDLSELMRVSEDTVRRDLKELTDAGFIIKVHGGAISKSLASPFQNAEAVYAQQNKQIIAEKALTLLKKDMVILTEGGTTMIEFAKAIPQKTPMQFFTISPQVAIKLSEKDNLDVITVGGRLEKNANLHTGSSVLNQLSEIRTDLCFLGANGFSAEDGLSDLDWEIVQVKKAIIRASNKTAILCISEKLNSNRRLKIANAQEIDYLITELPRESPMLDPYRKVGITVL